MRDIRAADQLVRLAYVVSELLGDEDAARRWLRTLNDGTAEADALPAHLTFDNRSLLAEQLRTAGVLADGHVDSYRVDELDQVMQLIPLVRKAERARTPAPRASLVCTLPPEAAVFLSRERRNFGRSLATLVLDALRSTTGEPLLIASPYWSAPGCERLRPALQRALDHGLPVTLAGARREDPGHHQAMVEFGAGLQSQGFDVRALRFLPPKDTSLFHAKIVCGKAGYLGSGNITAAGLEAHVEVGVPLTPADVAEAWWILGQLERVGLLEAEPD